MQASSDGPKMFALESLARENEAKCRVVIYDHAAVTVEYLAARRKQRERLDSIALSLLAVILAGLHPKVPKAGNQKKKDSYGDVLETRNLSGGELSIVVTEQRSAL